jgi:prolyl oligopeptidase
MTTWKPNTYPPARRSDHVDVYQSKARGTVRIHDPYQWLEENTEETNAWITAQEAYTKSYIAQESAERKILEDAIRANTNYAKVCTVQYLCKIILTQPTVLRS